MIKDEVKNIGLSLESVLGVVDVVYILDTGSTDGTQQKCLEMCNAAGTKLCLKEEPFVDFATSRNVMLDFIDQVQPECRVSYVVLMDAADELRGGDKLRAFVQHAEAELYMVKQVLESNGRLLSYYNTKLLKPLTGWRYVGPVHEVLVKQGHSCTVRAPSCIEVYQNRELDMDRTFARFPRDKKLLLKAHEEKPNDPRTLFYLANTCWALGERDDAERYYRMRIELGGFQEECLEAKLKIAENMMKRDEDPSPMLWKCWQDTRRMEPLYYIAMWYQQKKDWRSARMFYRAACDQDKPVDALLFVKPHLYDFSRWYGLAVACWYAGFYDEGWDALDTAAESMLGESEEKGVAELRNWYKRKVLVVCHPKSHEDVAVSLMNGLGLRVKQEQSGMDGVVSWLGAIENLRPPWYPNVPPRGPLHFFKNVYHLVRNPLECIGQTLAQESSTVRIRSRFVPEMDSARTPEEQAVLSWIGWNKLCEQCEPKRRLNAEEWSTWLPAVAKDLEIDFMFKEAIKDAPKLPASEHKLKSKDLRKKVSPEVWDEFVKMSKRYGYSV